MVNSLLDEYIENRFSYSEKSYMDSLKSNLKDKKVEKIYDIGTGPGQWAFACEKVWPDSLIDASDPNSYEIEYAKNYADTNEYKNIYFHVCGYEEIINKSEGNADLILCNGVLMYLDREKAFNIFSRLLKEDGVVLLFYNHHIGYYLNKTLESIKTLSIKGGVSYFIKPLIINPLKNLVRGESKGDTPLLPSQLQKIARKHGFDMTIIATMPKMNYKSRFFGFNVVYSIKLIKLK